MKTKKAVAQAVAVGVGETVRLKNRPITCPSPNHCSADEYVSTDWQVVMVSHGWPANTSALDDALIELAELRQDADDRKKVNDDI